MKKIYLTAIIVFTYLFSIGQSVEIEPNNNIGTANAFSEADPTDGTLTVIDSVDYHRLYFNYSGDFVLYVNVTNTGNGAPKTFNIDYFNTVEINNQYVGNFYSTGIQLNAGSNFSFPITVCGLTKDSFYIKLKGDGSFSYNIEWYPSNIYNTDDLFYGYNNTAAVAMPFLYNVQKEASVGYNFWGSNFFDTLDYFTSTLPAGNYNLINLKINARNGDCDNGQQGSNTGMRYACYKNGNPTPFATGFVGNNSSVAYGALVTSTVPLSNMAQGDVLLVKYSATSPFGYRFKYGLPDEFEPDDETGDVCQNAPTIIQNQVVTGNVGEYDNNADEFIDEADYYKIVLPHDGAIKLFVKGRNDECTNQYQTLHADIIDFNCNYLSTGTLMEWDNASCGTILLDTTKIRAFVAGTYYIRLYTNYHVKLSYSLKYQLVDSTAGEPSENFSGGSSTNTEPVNVGQTKKGHLRFHKAYTEYDPQDGFSTNIPQGGSVRMYLKATYRGDDTVVNNNFNFERLNFSGLGVGKQMPNNSYNKIIPDQVYRDTFLICGLDTGVAYFVLNTQKAWEYELRYELADSTDTDVDIEPNNTFAQATLAPNTVIKKGHIQYYGSNPLIDSYDYYKIIVGTSDSVKIMLQGTNKSCENNKRITVTGFNKNKVQIFSKVLGLNNNVLANQTVLDSIKIFVTAPDTIYLAFEATAPFNYQFFTKPFKPTSSFFIEGDSSVCIGTKTYTARKSILPGETVTYNWSLPLGGGTITTVDSIATVVWNATGNRSIQLSLFNAAGSSISKIRTVIVNSTAPAETPVVFNFARTLSVSIVPPGANCQWYRNAVLIAGATQSFYVTTLAGAYTVKFINPCGQGPISTAYNFAVNAIAQNITFPHVPTVTMSPTAKVKLNATANSGLPVYYTKISGPGTVVNDSLIITGVGTTIIKATQPGDATFSTAIDKYDTIIVIRGNHFIIFDTIPNQIFGVYVIQLNAVTSTQESVYYDLMGGYGIIYPTDTRLFPTGAGLFTVRASSNFTANYNTAAPVQRTFCIGVRTLTPITGDANPCLNTYRYNAQNIPGANYVWTLSGGGVLTFNKDTAWVQWQTPGSHTLTVKANTPCDATFTNTQSFTVNTSTNVPAVVNNMQPANNILNQKLPLTLSWIPGNNTVSYDLYVWDSAAVQPVTPYAANINNIQYILPVAPGLPYNRAYKWRVVSKNPCSITAGPIQQFRLIPLPDLTVSEVQAPATATSGQTITISWKVTNKGPGKTNTNDTWADNIYLALDTVPNISFQGSVNWDPGSFSSLTANGRPLLIGTKNRPVSLDSGQFYTNTATFTLPLSYNFPLYVYVITGNQNTSEKLLQFSYANDTLRKQTPMVVSLAPTPDLRTEAVFVPLSTFSGSTINVTYRVRNFGVVTPVGVGWGDAVYLSQNPLFDSANAIQLNAPKPNGSYYPNTFGAIGSNTVQLLPDSAYTKTIQAVIPNFIFGTWFIYVKANNNKYLYEGALSNNNINQAQLQVYLTPTPNLTINSLTVPVTNASTTQPIGVNWNIKNEGFADNFERGKGHDMYGIVQSCPCYAPPNSTCYAGDVLQDHPLLGSSYWLDRMYLSTDSTGLNIPNSVLIREVKHGRQEYPGLYYPDVIEYCFFGPEKINIETALHPNAVFPTTVNFKVPSDLQPANYYVYVVTNPTNTVFEYPGALQIKRSTLPITVQRPDVIVSSISAPPTSTGGTTLNINYSVLNNGLGAVFNHARKDRLYISNFSSFDGSAQVVGTQTFTEDVPVGTAVPQSFAYNIPPATTGNKYFYVQTNYDSLFKETNAANNLSISTVTTISAATAVDLFVSAVQPKDTVFTILPTTFKYTVTNIGTGTTTGTWTDSLFMSCSNTFSPSTSYFITKRTQTRAIATGGNYTDSFTHTIPKMSYDINACFPQVMHAPGYFYVKTNADNGVYEASATNNNVSGSGSKVILNPFVDHIVTSVSAPDTTTVGFAYPTNWTIKNIGYHPLNNSYSIYRDAIFFSTDSIADIADAKAGDYLSYTTLGRNVSLANYKAPITPTLLTGNYYVYAHTNHVNSIPVEKILTNNVNFVRNASGAAKKIHVIRPALADLTDSIISAQTSVAAGQPITIVYKVTNNGTGVTYPGNKWQNQLALSSDFILSLNGGDRLLVTDYRNSVLLPGQSYLDTTTVTIPSSTIPGNYVLISEANSNDVVVESNTNNNLGFSLLNVFAPPISDLTVTKVLKPDTVLLGYTMDTAKWIIKNASANEARGVTSDGLYLTSSNLFDSTATLLGVRNKNINMAPLQSDTISMAPLVMGVVEGNYNVVVKTDLLNNILESDKDNNTGMSVTPIYVKVKELKLNIAETNTLFNVNRYYKLIIPDSLLGSTLLVTLKSNDSLTKRNEMYIGGGYVPTPSNYDYQFEIPNYGNQQIVISSVTSSIYYINIRCVSPNVSVQNITLKAVKLPFAILNVQTNSGGNIGNVTVKIKGSLFTEGMTAKLSNGSTTINATAVYFTNSTQVYATFPLQGKPLGVYNVSLQKPDSSISVLANGFSIVTANNGGLITGGGVNTGSGNGNEPGCDPGAASGLNSQLVVDLLVPNRVLTNRPVVIQINYSNPTNFDIPAQSRILYSEAGMKMAFTKEGVPTGTTSLYLELVETGGPPGIIRAGGSGTIIVHSKSPARPPEPTNFVLFKLK
jgi:CARDB/PKD-like domain